MYCTECGTKGHGKFCANCGTRLLAPAAEPSVTTQSLITAEPLVVADALVPVDGVVPAIVVDGVDLAGDGSWTNSVHYEAIVRVAEVRSLIARAAEQSEKRLSGEEFLKFCDKAFSPLYGGVSMEKLVAIAHPIYVSLGVKTGKCERRLFSRPPGSVIVALLCSLARRGRPLKQVRQAADGCMFEATLPSDIWTLAGDLLIEVRAEPVGTAVEVRTVVKGQFFDWGKSKRCLDELFADLEMTPASLRAA